MTRTEEVHIENKIREAMTRANLPHNHVVKDVLLAEAEFADANSTAVRARGGVSLDERIEELKDDPRFRATFPVAPPTIARTDMRKLSENFTKIASGEIAVE